MSGIQIHAPSLKQLPMHLNIIYCLKMVPPLCPSFGLVVASDMRLEPGGRKCVCVCARVCEHVWMCLCVCVHACVHACVLFLAAELYQSCLGVRVVVNEPTQRTFFCPLTSSNQTHPL